jgi:20S proteasome alpha/beta subunit
LINQEIKEISTKIANPMTTVIGIKCKDAIVIASDSQATSETIKDLQASKIFPINKSIGIGAAVDIGHITELVDQLGERLNVYEFETDRQLRGYLDSLLVDLSRIYNLERSARLGYPRPDIIFNAEGLLNIISCNIQGV